MVKLLLQEGGHVRSFQLGDGVLSVGSGERAVLRVESQDVAELHFEIEVSGEGAQVRPSAGVVAPLVNGKPLSDAGTIGLREAVQVGEVILWLDTDESTSLVAPSTSSAPGKASPGQAKPAKLSELKGQFPPRAKGPRKNTKANYRGKQRVIESKRRTVKRGVPNAVLVAVPLLLVLVGFFVVRKRVEDANKSAIFSVSKMLDTVEQKLARSSLADAERELARIEPEHERSAADEARMQEIRGRMETMRAAEVERQGNLAGSKFLDVYLKRYEASKLKGDPSPARIRLFLLRTKEFRERWPKHAGMAWVDRMEARFEGSVDISQPPSYDDVAWELEYINIGENRNYKKAFELVAGLRSRSDGSDSGKLDRLEKSLRLSRDEHFQERMDKVDDVERLFGGCAKPVNWLLHLVLWCDDEALAEKAAQRLITIERADACLLGYKDEYPELYKGILAHPVIEEFARSKGLLN